MNLLSGSFVRSTKSGGGRGRCCRPHVAVDGPKAFRIDCAQYILNCLADGGVGPKCGWLIQMVKIIVQNECPAARNRESRLRLQVAGGLLDYLFNFQFLFVWDEKRVMPLFRREGF